MLKLHSVTIAFPESSRLTRLAGKLAAQLESYRVPGDVRSRIGIRHIREVEEPWLIVLCVPETREDPGVLGEIRRFTEDGRYHQILTLLVDGKPEESFPEPLLHEELPDGTVVDHEPLAANIVAPSEGAALRKLKVEKLRLLAPILGVSFDELMNRRRKRKIRILAAFAAAVLAGGCLFLGIAIHRAAVFSDQQEKLTVQYGIASEARDRATEEKESQRRSLATSVGVEAEQVVKTGDTELTMLLCLEFLPDYGDLQELTGPLKDALDMRCAAGYVPVTAGKLEYIPYQRESWIPMEEFLEKTGVPDVDYYTERQEFLFTKIGTKGYLFRADPLELLFSFENEHTLREGKDDDFDIVNYADGELYLMHHNDYLYKIPTGELVRKKEWNYGDSFNASFSSDGYGIVWRASTQVLVYDIVKDSVFAVVSPPFWPLSSTQFAGERSEALRKRDSSKLLINGIFFHYQEGGTKVPETLPEQIALARKLLNGRTLTAEERDQYGLGD